MKILILGENGMLGHVVYNYFKEKNYEVVGTRLQDGKIVYDAYKNQEFLEEIINEQKPNVVINCIGILNQVAEENKSMILNLFM